MPSSDPSSSNRVLYRPNVAGIVRRSDGSVLIGERSDVAGAWQFPQGGVDSGETSLEALVRELEEEIGLKPGKYRIGPMSGPHRYEFPNDRTREGYGGQEQTWYLVNLKGGESGITHETSDREFRALKWIAPGDFRLGWLAPMKHDVYRVVMREFFGVELRD